VFDDFIRLTLYSLLNNNPASHLDKERVEQRESEYLKIVGKYKKELVNVFPELLADAVLLMEK